MRSRLIFRAAEVVYHAVQSLRLKSPASLDLAYVACGRLDGYFEFDLQVWDASAGALILTEAGGVITDWHGQALSHSGKVDVIAGNMATHRHLLELLSELGV
jgi:myo-inositol-1(or 4)-monophosphatase